MSINYDNIEEIRTELTKQTNKLLKIKIKIEQLNQVIKAHKEGIYNPTLFEELMKRCK